MAFGVQASLPYPICVFSVSQPGAIPSVRRIDTRSLQAASLAGVDLQFVGEVPNLWDRAVLNDDVEGALRLSSIGVSSGCGDQLACWMLRVVENNRFELCADSLITAASAGADIARFHVNPKEAMRFAVPISPWSNSQHMRQWIEDALHRKVCQDQPLLAVAIFCGQKKLSEYLVQRGCCVFPSLRSADLSTKVPGGLYSWGDASKYEDTHCLQAAKAAFLACPKHDIALLQMARWWTHMEVIMASWSRLESENLSSACASQNSSAVHGSTKGVSFSASVGDGDGSMDRLSASACAAAARRRHRAIQSLRVCGHSCLMRAFTLSEPLLPRGSPRSRTSAGSG